MGVGADHRHGRGRGGADRRLPVVERRAAEPVIPLGLFGNRVFSAASAVGFVMGFAMFGALTFLPIFFQDARGLSPPRRGCDCCR